MNTEPQVSESKPTLEHTYRGVLGLSAIAVLLIHIARFIRGDSQDWTSTLGVSSNVATVAGISIGGWWALRTIRRQRIEEKRMDVAHVTKVWRRTVGTPVLRVGVTFKNIGLVSLRPVSAETVIHCPPVGALKSDLQPSEYWKVIGRATHPVVADEVELEPGEGETYWHDIELPSDADVIQVHSIITCDGREVKFWDETSLVSIEATPKVN